MHPEFPYVAFIAATLVLVPFPWHWRAGNVATIMIMLWLFAVNVIYGVDAIIWRHNVDVRMAIWCDITTKIIIAANIALPAACMCVCIHLESVASVRHVRSSLADKRRRQFFDGFFCFFLPVVWMAVHYVVQGHRFDIIEEFGCRPSIYMSIPAIFLIWVPPFLFAVVTFVFAALALVHFFRRRITFAKHLESRSGLSPSRYMRLILMAVFEIVFAVTSTSVTLWVATLDIRPWTNWDDIHFNFSRVDQYPSLYISSFVERYYTAIWWIIPLSSAMFFVFFAFGQEAIRDYKAVFSGIREKIFKLRVREFRKHTNSDSYKPSPSLPLYKSSPSTKKSLPRTVSYDSTMADETELKDKDSLSPPSSIETHVLEFTPSHSASVLVAEDRQYEFEASTPTTASSTSTLHSP